MKFSQKYKTWNIPEKNINKNFNKRDPEVLKLLYKRFNERARNIPERVGIIYIQRTWKILFFSIGQRSKTFICNVLNQFKGPRVALFFLIVQKNIVFICNMLNQFKELG